MPPSVLISSDSAACFTPAPHTRSAGFSALLKKKRRLSNTGAWAKCFSIISPMLCHADSRLEQNGCCACVLREKGVQERERRRPGDGEKETERMGWGKQSLAVMLALGQVIQTLMRDGKMDRTCL